MASPRPTVGDASAPRRGALAPRESGGQQATVNRAMTGHVKDRQHTERKGISLTPSATGAAGGGLNSMLAAAEAASSAHDRAAGHDATASARFRAHPGIREVLQKSQFFCSSSHEFIDAVLGAMMVQKFNAGDQILSAAGHNLAILELGEWWLEDWGGRPLRRVSGTAAADLLLFDIKPTHHLRGDAARPHRITAKSSAMARVLSLELWNEILDKKEFYSERRRVQALASALSHSPGVWHPFEFDVVDFFRIIKERIATVTSMQLNSSEVWRLKSVDQITTSDVFCFHVKNMDQAQAQFEELLKHLAMDMRREVFFPGDEITADDDCGALRVLRTGRVGEFVGTKRVNDSTGPTVISTAAVFRDAGEKVSGVKLIAETCCEVFTLYPRVFKDSVITGRSELLQVLTEIPRPPETAKESALMLRKARVFDGLSSSFIAALAKQSVKRLVFPGKALARNGELCLLQAGRAIVHGENDTSYRIESGSVVNELQIYGVEIEAFDRAHHEIIAETPCMVESFYPSVMAEIREEFPEDDELLDDAAEELLALTNVHAALDGAPFFENFSEAFLCDVAGLFQRKEVDALNTTAVESTALIFEPDLTDKGSAEYLELLKDKEVCILEGGLNFLTGGLTRLTAPCKGKVHVLDDHASFEKILERPCFSREKKLVQELRAHFKASRDYKAEGAQWVLENNMLSPFFEDFGLDQADVANCLEVELIMPGQRLIGQDDSGDVLYVLLEGAVRRTPHGEVAEEHIAELGHILGGKFLGLPVHETVSSAGVGVVGLLRAKSLPDPKEKSADDQENLPIALLASLPIMEGATVEFVEDISKHLVQWQVKQGQNICEQGRAQNDLLILTHGISTLNLDGRDVHSLYDGTYAGEFAVLGFGDGERCGYTLKAETDCLIFVLNQEDFIEVLREHKDELDRLKKLGSDLSGTGAEALTTHPLFDMCPKSFIDIVANKLEKRTLLPQDTLVLQHDSWHCFFIIEHGVLEVYRDNESVMRLTPGRSMCELQLLGYADRSEFSVKALTIAHVVLLDREALGFTLMGHAEIRADIFSAGKEMKERLLFHQKALLTIAAEKRVAKRSERAFQKVVRYTERGKIKSRSPYQRTLPARPKSPHVRTPARARLMQNIAQWCERRQELHETARLKRSADFKDNYDDASAVKLTPSPDFLWTSASVQRPKYQWSMDSVATGAGSSLAYSGAGSGSLARQAQKVVEMTTRATIRARTRPRTASARLVSAPPQNSSVAPSARSAPSAPSASVQRPFTPDWALQAWGTIPTGLDASQSHHAHYDPADFAGVSLELRGSLGDAARLSELAQPRQRGSGRPAGGGDGARDGELSAAAAEPVDRSKQQRRVIRSSKDTIEVQSVVAQHLRQIMPRDFIPEDLVDVDEMNPLEMFAKGRSRELRQATVVKGRSREQGQQRIRPSSAMPAPKAPQKPNLRTPRPETARRYR